MNQYCPNLCCLANQAVAISADPCAKKENKDERCSAVGFSSNCLLYAAWMSVNCDLLCCAAKIATVDCSKTVNNLGDTECSKYVGDSCVTYRPWMDVNCAKVCCGK